MKYMKEILLKNKILVIIYIIIGIVSAFLTNYKIDYLQKVINGLTDNNLKLGNIIVYGVILISYYMVNYIDEYPGKKLGNQIFLDFKLLSLKKISKIDYLEYQSLGTGKLTQRIENGSEASKSITYDFGLCVLRQLIPNICFSVLFIWKINSNITYGILIGYIVIFIITNVLLKVLYKLKEKILCNEEKMNHFLVRGFMEMVVFRLENRFPSEIKKASKAQREIVNSKVKMNMIHEAFFTIFALLVAVLDVGVLLYAWYSKTISVGGAVALISLIDNAYTPIAIFNVLFVQYKLDKSTFKRFQEFLEMKDDFQLNEGNLMMDCSGDIEIKKLSFAYKNRTIFKEFDLTITYGEKVAFVGSSGSGKTTLIKLILGLLKYDNGSIKINGQEVSEICLNSLYENISYISQDSPVFDGTIRENIVFDEKISDSNLNEALKKVQLFEITNNMKDGLETMIGERGTILSGGEKQRLALTRLWFHENNIVILDEATSAMDNITEELVMDEVINLLKDKTVLAISHRLNSIKEFDRIIVFNQGKIVGQGTFAELMKSNSYFINLYNGSVLNFDIEDTGGIN
ncbi:ABC transporter ATP-binding protein [Clostridium novyi A str. 4552]|uniref:ABC transporter ATP-binding protein n=1 Tax=Clostridium novyi A str. 4552 TaxID=1444289 RepID=A0A0A0HWU7_CLONO|nr:ABC transporter ATP-binding protein [Clostridium novyi]KGM92843.1 ABC transporter ATP-binding protein [Clostridium novyi A str. 4552]